MFGITLSERAMTDGLSVLYQELLSGSYDCVDRIVLNAYFGMGHSPGGFRVWWGRSRDRTKPSSGCFSASTAIPRLLHSM